MKGIFAVIETATNKVVVTESPLQLIPLESIGLNTDIWEGNETDANDMAGRLGVGFHIISSPRPH